MILLEGDYGGVIVIIAAIMVGPALLFALIGLLFLKNHKKTAKVFFILAVVYLIISFGACGLMLAGG